VLLLLLPFLQQLACVSDVRSVLTPLNKTAIYKCLEEGTALPSVHELE